MKSYKKQIFIPIIRFNSSYFHCPKCGWIYPGPILVKGDTASNIKCQKCGNSYLVRKN